MQMTPEIKKATDPIYKKISKAIPSAFFTNHIKEILFFGLGLYWAVILFSTFLNI